MPWDFALILLFFATAVPLLGRRRVRQLMRMEKTTKADRLTLYASTILFQWAAAALILWRTTVHGILPSSLGVAIPNPALSCAVLVVLTGLVLANQLVSLRRLALRPSEAHGIVPQLALKIFPQDNAERLAFFAVVVTVSLCEEFIFRGFAQRVFQDASGGSVLVGVLSSALLFGIEHAYQGRPGLIATSVVGVIFGAVRSWTGSLLAVVVAHFAADLAAGFLAPSKLRAARAISDSPATGTGTH